MRAAAPKAPFRCERVQSLTPEERGEALELLSRNFPLNYEDGRAWFDFFLSNVPGLEFLVGRTETGRMGGIFCLLKREMNYFGIPLKVTGISYITTAPEFRTLRAADALIRTMLTYSEEAADLSLGFGRRAMDGYWVPYGYSGLTNFGRVTLAADDLTPDHDTLTVRTATESDLSDISRLYEDSYGDLLGPLRRTPELWTYYVYKLAHQKMSMECLCQGETVRGYWIRQGNLFHELALDNGAFPSLPALLRRYASPGTTNRNEVQLEIGLRHPAIRILRESPHSVSTRFVWIGGHIVRINSPLNFLIKVLPVLEKRLRRAKVSEARITLNGILLEYQSSDRLHIRNNPNISEGITFPKRAWPKLLLGVLPPEDIGDFKMNQDEAALLSILFPPCSPQIPFADQL